LFSPLLLSICLALLFSGCEQPVQPAPQIPKVTVAIALERTVEPYESFTGNLVESESLDVVARVQGFLQSADFTEGDPVAEGQTLFTIEPEPFQARVNQADAQLEQTEARIQLTQANLARAEQLVKSGAVTKEEYQTRLAENNAALATRMADLAALEQAKIEQSYTIIKAPFAGLVGRKLVDPGNLVGTQGATLLTTVRKVDPIDVYFDVSESLLLEMLKNRKELGERSNVPVELGLPNEEGYPHRGVIDFVDNTADAGTGTIQVRGKFPNADGLLYPGLFVRLRVSGRDQKPAVLVRERAIGADLGGKYVLVINDQNIVEHRQVELGQQYGAQRVIKSGVSAGDKYIVQGLQRARPGKPVEATLEQSPTTALENDKSQNTNGKQIPKSKSQA
jgi:RND family efflux transporter MFP subunit